MNNFFSESVIRQLSCEFQACRTYKEKLILFDRHFGLFQDAYPAFDPALDMFTSKSAEDLLVVLYEKDRKHAIELEKTFSFPGGTVVFNITPLNSYPELFNDFIISKFLENDIAFNLQQSMIKKTTDLELMEVLRLEKEATGLINSIRQKIVVHAASGLQHKFMTVFYEGYFNYLQKNNKKFQKRRKIIELFLYSRGIQYGRYIDELRNRINLSSDGRPAPQLIGSKDDLAERLLLLKETGILDFLRQKYRVHATAGEEAELTLVVSQLLGGNAEKISWLMNHFS